MGRKAGSFNPVAGNIKYWALSTINASVPSSQLSYKKVLLDPNQYTKIVFSRRQKSAKVKNVIIAF